MMKRSLFSLILVFVVQWSVAQRPALHKMSSLVREAFYATQTGSDAAQTRSADKRRGTMLAFVKLEGSDETVLERNHCRVLARYGSLFVAEIPLERLKALSLERRVHRIEAGRRATALMDTACHVVKTPAAYRGLDLPRGYTGKGVVVGVQDIGFDLTHPTFYSSDMSVYRIKAMWDQLAVDTVGSPLPVGRDYKGRDELLALGHPRDGLTQTHGTHTAGTAAGSGAQGSGSVSPYRGVAYDSDLCLVCNVTTDDAALIDPNDYYKYTYALDALGFKYIFDYADSVGKPCVINFSEGSHQDFRGDDQLYYEMLDSLCGPGRIIVSSAGNEGQLLTHVGTTPGQAAAGLFWNSTHPMTSVTTKTTGDFTIQIRHYADPAAPLLTEIKLAAVTAAPDSTYIDSVRVAGHLYRIVATAYPSSYDARETVCDWTMTIDDKSMERGVQTSICLADATAPVDMYLLTGYYYHSPLDPSLRAGSNAYSIYSPGSAPGVICVGATAYRTQFTNYLDELKVYDSGTNGVRANYSSVGPTWDHRTKPDVMAPGQNIVSSYSTFYINNPDTPVDHLASTVSRFVHNGRTYAWTSDGGTSMAAPIVTGIIALWLEADPTLTAQDCLDIFAQTCRRHDSSLIYPNNLYGHGEIDAHEGLKKVLERLPTGITSVATPTPQSDAVYSIDGRLVARSLVGLPRGIYIYRGKKLVVTR